MTEPRNCPGYHPNGDKPIRDGYLCRGCQTRAERALGDLPALTRELETTVTRQDRVASAGKRAEGHARPLVVNLDADRRGRTILELLFEWADYVAAWHHRTGLPVFSRDTPLTTLVPRAVAMLLEHPDWMRHNEQGPVLAEAAHNIRRDLRRLVDQPPARLLAGPCRADLGYPPELNYRCELTLYRKWGSETITCDGHRPDSTPGQWTPSGCGAVHTDTDRDTFLVDSVEERLLPLRMLWEALHRLVPGSTLDWKTVQRWTRERREPIPAKPGERQRYTVTPPRLTPAGLDLDGNPLYRGSDVLRLARDDQPRRGRRRIRRIA